MAAAEPINRNPSRAWVFTWNNYPDNWKELLEIAVGDGYCVAGEEVAPETGTPHLQGYCYWRSDKSFLFVTTRLPRVRWAQAKGNPSQNYRYCTKDGKFIELNVEARPRSIGRPKPKEKPNYWELLRGGATERDLLDRGLITSLSQLRFVRELGGMVSRDRFRGRDGKALRERPIDFIWVTGESGAGKSEWIYRNLLDDGDAPHIKYVGMPRWWNGIQDHGISPVVWIDELHDLGYQEFCQFVTMFDKGCIDVEVKNGHATIRPSMVIVASTTTPADLPLEWSRDRRVHLTAIVRRITDMYLVKPVRNGEGHIVDRAITRIPDALAHYGFLRRHVEDGYGRVGEGDGYPARGWAAYSNSFRPGSHVHDIHDRDRRSSTGMRDEDRGMAEGRIDVISHPRFMQNGAVIIHDELGRVSHCVRDGDGNGSGDEDDYSDADDILEIDEP